MIRGVPHEYIAYNVDPDESRGRLREAAALIVKAWTEPEPFGWEGEFYQYPSVSIWPKPLQRPHPPILMSASNEELAEFAGRHRAMMGMTLIADLEIARRCIGVYRETARGHGLEPTPAHILLGYNTCIADTDAEARAHLSRGPALLPPRADALDPRRAAAGDPEVALLREGARRALRQPAGDAEGALDRRDDRGGIGAVRQPRERA